MKISNRKTLLERQIFVLNKLCPKANIIVVNGFKYKKTRILLKYSKLEIIENTEIEKTNCLYSIALAIKSLNLQDNLMIIPGNSYFKDNIFNKFDNKKSQLWLTREPQELGCVVNNNRIQNVMWTLPNYWSNIGFFQGEEFIALREMIQNNTMVEKLFLFEAINQIIDDGGQFDGVMKKNKITFINKVSDIPK